MEGWEYADPNLRSAPADRFHFIGYDQLDVSTRVAARRELADGRLGLILEERPFYVESGGQISDGGEVVGEGWRLEVEDVRKIDGRVAIIGRLEGSFHWGPVLARVPRDIRQDTERNHTATHLLHAALRQVLGEHVHQRGSLVAPDRLRFDFSHSAPLTADEVSAIEELVNREIARAIPVDRSERPYAEAIASGAMALFGEKYGDVVRVITVPGFSAELCGGTHVRNTSEILQFQIVSETGVEAARDESRRSPDGVRMPARAHTRARWQRSHAHCEHRRTPQEWPRASSSSSTNVASSTSGSRTRFAVVAHRVAGRCTISSPVRWPSMGHGSWRRVWTLQISHHCRHWATRCESGSVQGLARLRHRSRMASTRCSSWRPTTCASVASVRTSSCGKSPRQRADAGVGSHTWRRPDFRMRTESLRHSVQCFPPCVAC